MSSATPGAGNEAAGNAGLFSALRNVATTLVATARTRVELAGNDLELERLRLVRALIFGLSALFCFGVGLLMLIGLVLILNWESRVVVLAAFGGGFLIYGAIKATMGLRLSQEDEYMGADLSIHKITAQPDYNRGEV